MRDCVASLEATSLFGNLQRTYRSPKASPVSSLRVSDVQHRENLDLKIPIWLNTLPLGVFPRIEVATIEISLIKLLRTNNFVGKVYFNFAKRKKNFEDCLKLKWKLYKKLESEIKLCKTLLLIAESKI